MSAILYQDLPISEFTIQVWVRTSLVKCTLEDINVEIIKGKLDTAMQLRGVTVARAMTSMKRA